ncbi:hypothetical protein ACFL3Q_12815 [Planctomycetota bacterium]
MIEHQITDPKARRIRECYYLNQGIRPEDPRFHLDRLPLGRIATSDWSNGMVLDRMMMYERRIENSVIKIMKELKRFQTIHRIEWQDVEKQREPSPSLRDSLGGHRRKASCGLTAEAATQSNSPSHSETATQPVVKECKLKKQTQYIEDLTDVKSLFQGDYGNKPAGPIEENKANSKPIEAKQACPEPVERSQLHESVLAKVAPNRKKSPAAATG